MPKTASIIWVMGGGDSERVPCTEGGTLDHCSRCSPEERPLQSSFAASSGFEPAHACGEGRGLCWFRNMGTASVGSRTVQVPWRKAVLLGLSPLAGETLFCARDFPVCGKHTCHVRSEQREFPGEQHLTFSQGCPPNTPTWRRHGTKGLLAAEGGKFA